MSIESDYSYNILGLKPGASPSEIRAAYRRLAKLYHPDHDQSLDGEVKYREIRAAYEGLRNWHLSDTGKAYESSDDCYDTSTQTAWTSQDWSTEYDIVSDIDDLIIGSDKRAKRIPFSLGNLPTIFIASLKELANVGVVLQVLLAAFFLSLSYAPIYVPTNDHQGSFFQSKETGVPQVIPHKNCVWIIGLMSALSAIVLRYYVTLRRKGVYFSLLITVLYATLVTLIVQLFYPEATEQPAIFAYFFSASIVLVYNPLGVLLEPMSFRLRNMFGKMCDANGTRR